MTNKNGKTLTKEVTLEEIEEHLKQQDRETKRGYLLTFAAFGGSVALVGTSLWIGSGDLSLASFRSEYGLLFVVGLAAMVLAKYKVSRIKDEKKTGEVTQETIEGE